MTMSRSFRARFRPSGFTLVEILTVIAIIAILAALTISAYTGVMKNSARARARSEIAAISAALESYKADNGGYPSPQTPTFSTTNDYTASMPNTAAGSYLGSSELLYQSLTGQTNYGDAPPTPASGVKVYFTFKKSQLGNDQTGAGGPIYVQDPFGNSYGYFSGLISTTTTNAPNNGVGLYDLWSTGGATTTGNGATNTFITDWGS
jgi:prepilin-type N-terminal cleavage/methylation domain-containing protein